MLARGRELLQVEPLFLLIDGHALIHRAFHAFQGQGRTLTVARTGETVSGVYGFASTLLKTVGDVRPTYWGVAYDRPTPTFRHRRFAAYKAQRPPTPPELLTQVQRVHQLAEAFGLPIFEVDGFEADDLLGTLCCQAVERGTDVLILTGDTDTLQLVGPHARVRFQSGVQQVTLYNEKAVRERYGGLTPSQVPDYKALVGDPSDNIPGLQGVGEKTATKLLLQFGSLEGISANLEKVMPEKLRTLLQQEEERLFWNRDLCTIVKEAPVRFDPEECSVANYDRSRVVEFFRELEFTTLTSRLPASLALDEEVGPVETPSPKDEELSYLVVDTPEALEELAQALVRAGTFSLDTETTTLNAMEAQPVGLSFATDPEGDGGCHNWYVPVGHRQGHQLSLQQVASVLGPLLAREELKKVAHNANYDMMVLSNAGLELRGLLADTMIAAHLLGYRSLGLKALVLTKLQHEMTEIRALIGTGKNQLTFDQVPIQQAAPYACADAYYTLQLWKILEPDLQREHQMDLFRQVEMPLVPVLVRVQRHGIALDTTMLDKLSKELAQQIGELVYQAYEAVGHQFNINSPQQLSQVLFGDLKLLQLFTEQNLPRPKRTQGGYSTDAQVLEDLRGSHPVVELILDYRQSAKLKSTYLDALPALVNSRTGRVHTSFNQAGAVTGRVSSSEPNLQNIPVRTEVGQLVRKAFQAEGAPEWLLLSADYSQIELRVLAHFCQDPRLMGAFLRDEDIHASTASEAFGVPLESVTSEHRRLAKMINFGLLYGMREFGLAQRSGLPREEAAVLLKSYFDKYPGIVTYLEQTKKKARELGYVETLLGRRRSTPEINASNAQVRAAAERMAVNMPIQGTAADIIKVAMVRLQERMDSLSLKSKMLLQVHDELIFEVPGEELETMKALAREIMSQAVKLSVALRVDVKTGYRWGEMG